MNRCKNCKLRLKGRRFNPELLQKVPLHLRKVFICDNEEFIRVASKESKPGTNICSMDLWVLTFVGIGDPYAVKNAEGTLKSLVASGASELLCNLFENSSYEVRRSLWLRMTEEYSDRLYLFNSLFEKECLAPLNSENTVSDLHLYQYSMLYNISSAPAMFDDL